MATPENPLPPSLISLLRARKEMFQKTPSVLPQVHHKLHRVAMEKPSFTEAIRRRLSIAAERFRDGTGIRIAVAMLGVAILSAILIVRLTGEGKVPIIVGTLQPGDVVLKIDSQKKMQVVVSRGRRLLILSLSTTTPDSADEAPAAAPEKAKP